MKRVIALKEDGFSVDTTVIFGGKVKDDCRENRVLPEVIEEILRDNASIILSHKNGERIEAEGFGMTIQGRVEAYEDVVEITINNIAA